MKKTVTTLIDDISGEQLPEGHKPTLFGYEGTNYTIDLSDKNKEKLSKALAPFIEVATRVSNGGGKRSGAAASGSGRPKEELADIRAWATEQGMKVSERGRISADIIEAYDARG